MIAQMSVLQTEIHNDLLAMGKVYSQLDEISQQTATSQRDIVLGYYLHVLYGLFENMFVRIAKTFENHLDDKSQWHAQLLQRMTLDVTPIRPAVIGQETYQCLRELQGFRHLFRNAYLLQFDPHRLDLVWQQAVKLRAVYETDINIFLDFLKEL